MAVPGYVVPTLPKNSGTGIDVALIPVTTPVQASIPVPDVCRTDFTEVSATGIDVVPNVPKYPVPVSMLY